MTYSLDLTIEDIYPPGRYAWYTADGKIWDLVPFGLTETLDEDLTAIGLTEQKQAGEILSFGDICYFHSDGKVYKADANVAGKYPAMVMAIQEIAADAYGSFLLWGNARKDAWNWTVGGILYLSTGSGNMTQTPPDDTDDAVQVLGVAHPNGNTIYFKPSVDYITITEFDDYVEVSGTYVISNSNSTINCTSGTFNVTLPTAVGIEGKVFIIKNSGIGVITVDTTSSQLIDGGSSVPVIAGTSLTVQSTNAGWIIIT